MMKEDEQGRAVHMCGWSMVIVPTRCAQVTTHPSARGQSRLGPRTMAMLLGVILFTACCSDNRDRNWTRYLTERSRKKHIEDREIEEVKPGGV